MASDTGIGAVCRTSKPGLIHKQGDPAASGVGLEEVLVGMAIQAKAVFQRGNGRNTEGRSQKTANRDNYPENDPLIHATNDSGSREGRLYITWRFFFFFCVRRRKLTKNYFRWE